MFVVTVAWTLRSEHIARFMELMLAQAKNSLDLEADCHRFDVCQSPDDPASVFLYEVYTDRAAFDTHLATPHFAAFDAAISGLHVAKIIRFYDLVAERG